MKAFVPGKRALLWILPGVALAILGISMFALVENDANYPYTHSVWHVCMSVSIVFLLPRKRLEVLKGTYCCTGGALESSHEVVLVNNMS